MRYQYGDHPTKKEFFIEHRSKNSENLWKDKCIKWKHKFEQISLISKNGTAFRYLLTPYLIELITRISEQKGFLDALPLNKTQEKKIITKALNHEAYYSSHIEGAKSSLDDALRFIKKEPAYTDNENLQMIGNNQRALTYVLNHLGTTLSHELIYTLQHILTENTHNDHPITMGQYRHGPVYILNNLGQVVYEGPPAQKVHTMMDTFTNWLNNDININILIKAGIAHLYFVHVHPFDDGNGRTARALSNFVLANSGFKFINMISLSSYFDHKRPSYYKAIQDVDTHDHDLTYFLIFYMEALLEKIIDVKNEIERLRKISNIKEIISNTTYSKLNPRQIKAIKIMLKANEPMTTKKYHKINKCSDETARKDFNHLIKLQLIIAKGDGRSRNYQLSKKITNA